MKAIYIERNGGPEVLQLSERPDLQAGEGQLLLNVRASGINFADLLAREGTYPPAPKAPMTPGLEVAGTIAQVGANVQSFRVGDRVMALLSGGGGYAESALIDSHAAVKLPDELDFAPATALLVQGLTAYFLLQDAPMKKGDSVLVNAAAGGVGSLAVQIAKLLGAGTVVGTASSEAKRELVKSLGADAAVDYTRKGWAEDVKAATNGRGVDVFLDATGELDGEGFDALADGGRWVIYGAQSGEIKGLPGERAGAFLWRALTLKGFSLYSAGERIPVALQQLISWTTSGQLKIESGDRFPLRQAKEAHEAIANRKTSGKVVLEP